MKKRVNIILDDDDRRNAQMVADYYGLDSLAAAIRFALKELARKPEQTKEQPNDTAE